MFGRAVPLMRASWQLMWAEQSLVLLAVAPICTFAAIVVVEAAVASLAPTAALALLVPAALTVVFASMFWSAAIVAAANEVAEGRSPTVLTSVQVAAAYLPEICAWALYSLTVGVAIRVVSGVFGRFGAFFTWAGETAWSIATMLVLPAIVLDGASPPDARRRSRERFRDTWAERVTGQLGFDLVGAALALPGFVLVVAAALVDNGPLLSVSLLLCVGGFIGAALVTSACLSVYRTMLYRSVMGRPLPPAFAEVLPDAPTATGPAPAAARTNIGVGSRPVRSR
jgi:hypothetical protein